jgi:hypothetical protein
MLVDHCDEDTAGAATAPRFNAHFHDHLPRDSSMLTDDKNTTAVDVAVAQSVTAPSSFVNAHFHDRKPRDHAMMTSEGTTSASLNSHLHDRKPRDHSLF